MIWSAVLPGAALRVMRTAAGRRALHVALLVGGLFVLGVVCGERAQAADGAPSLRDTVRQVVDVPVGRPATEAREPAPLPPKDVLAAVGDVVERTTERLPLLSAASGVDPGLSVPGFTDPGSSDPPAPAWPSLPPLSELPDPSGAGGPDGWADPSLPDGRQSDPAGADDSARPSAGADTSDAADPDKATEPRTATVTTDTDTDTGPDATDHATHIGPAPGAVETGAQPPVTHSGTPGRATPAPTDHAPTRHAPTGAPDGSLGTATGADQGMPRHGDAHAVTPQHRIPFRLVPVALERAHTGETRDPFRDIPVSPA
ncbi:hypothetical protein ACF07W_07075 [Streptomyces sp. NPDC015140]|uniref:hypothetical protein n=1 Tax=Streptomyces sp. NPDC015140 TaxID=3364943 RepID=UPI0037013271